MADRALFMSWGTVVSGEQLAALQESEEWQRAMIDSELVVDGFSIVAGYANEGVARQIGLYQGEIAKVPQSA